LDNIQSQNPLTGVKRAYTDTFTLETRTHAP